MILSNKYKTGIIIVLAVGFLTLCPEPARSASSILELAARIKTAKDPHKVLEAARELEKLTPGSAQEVEAILDVIAVTKGGLQDKAIGAIARIEDPQLGAVFLPRLKSPNPMVQAVAAGICGKLKVNEAVPDIIKLLEQAEPVEGFADTPAERAAVTAALALGEIGDERGIPVLLSKLGQMISYETKALGKFGAQVVPKVFEIINASEDARVRKFAAQVLVYLKDPSAAPHLWKEVRDPNSKVRRYALVGLLKLEEKQALPELIQFCQQEKDPMVEAYLLFHINTYRLRDKFLCPFLIQVLKESAEPKNRKGAALALARVGGEAAVSALEKASRKDEDAQVRVYAAQALDMLAKPSADAD